MKALLVTMDFPPAVGGIQAVLYNTACHLNRIGVTVVAPNHPDADAFDRTQPFPIHRVTSKAASRPQRLYRFAQIVIESFRVLYQEGADVILCGHPFTAPVGLLAKRVLGKPYVVWTHAHELTVRHRFLRQFLRPADAVLVISNHNRRLVKELGVPAEKMVGIPYAPDCDPKPESSPANSPNHQRTILTVARMDDLYKGHDTMLRAMPVIAAKVPNVRWVVVGNGPLKNHFENMAEALGVKDKVQFTGALSRADRDRLLQSCNVFVMISRDRNIDGGSEGFGIVYLEANAFGKPVIAGRVGGALDAVVDGVTGLLVNPENELEVAEAVIALLTNPGWAAQLGQQGQERVQRNFTWDMTASAVEEVLFDVTHVSLHKG